MRAGGAGPAMSAQDHELGSLSLLDEPAGGHVADQSPINGRVGISFMPPGQPLSEHLVAP